MPAVNRYYNPKLGRYIEADPIGLEGGLNPYVYAGNDPVNMVDPTGLMSMLDDAAMGGTYGHQMDAAMFDSTIRNMQPLNDYQMSNITGRGLPLLSRLASAGSRLVGGRGDVVVSSSQATSSLLSRARSIIDVQSDKDWQKNQPIYYKYLNQEGFNRVLASGLNIPAGSDGRNYITWLPMNQSEAHNNLFLGSTYDGYGTKGSHVMMFQLQKGVPLNLGTQPNELYYNGTLRQGRHISKTFYFGPNPF